MLVEIRVPPLGESITEATVGNWLKKPGQAVGEGDVLIELETDKVMVEVPAPQSGVLTEASAKQGATVKVGELLGKIDTEAKGAAAPSPAPAAKPAAPPQPPPAPAPVRPAPAAAAPPAPSARAAPAVAAAAAVRAPAAPPSPARNEAVGPAVRRMAEEQGLDTSRMTGTGKRGQVTKEDVVNLAAQRAPAPGPAAAPPPRPAAPPPPAAPRAPGEREERVKMSRLRQTIAARMLQAQSQAAMLTTFNEVDMSAAMDLRTRTKEAFQRKHGIGLGFMSLFTKACVEALKAYPGVNGEIQGDEIVYKHYYDIGVAVSTERGLIVPVVRDADRRSCIEIELEIADLAKRAREGHLTLGDLSGGTFSITNGGIFGSLMSTPILNPPQSGILGMHNIVKRPVVVADQIVARPMMYIALSYDHRLVDGREAVLFLVKVKECIENPLQLLLDL